MVHMHTRSFPRLSIFTATSKKKKNKNPLDKPRKTHPAFPFFSLPLPTGLKSTRMRGSTETEPTKKSDRSPGMEEECSKAGLPRGSVKGEGGRSASWHGQRRWKLYGLLTSKAVLLWGPIAGYRTLDLFGVGARRKCWRHVVAFIGSASDFSWVSVQVKGNENLPN